MRVLLALLAVALLGAGGYATVGLASVAPIICDNDDCTPPPPTTTVPTTTTTTTSGGGGSTTTTTTSDADRDGVIDTYDNCKGIYNPAQSDGDNDRIGDDCDDTNNYGTGSITRAVAYNDASWSASQTLTSLCPSGSSGRLVRTHLESWDKLGIRHFWTWEVTGKFCWKGGVVTAVRDLLSRPTHTAWPYKWSGNVFAPRAIGIGLANASIEAQAQFETCVFRWGCYAHIYPRVSIKINGLGQYSWSYGS